jgi:DNA-binding CsgD family transcriptional regulator
MRETIEPWDRRDNPEQSYSQRQTADKVRKAIQQMSPKYRKVFELRQISDLSLSEIAKSLSISVPAVKSRLYRARKQLRDYGNLAGGTGNRITSGTIRNHERRSTSLKTHRSGCVEFKGLNLAGSFPSKAV